VLFLHKTPAQKKTIIITTTKQNKKHREKNKTNTKIHA
jgi:hypothetical protein